MASTTQQMHPPLKLTVGAQYICFNTMGVDGTWTEAFEDTIYKLPTVVDVEFKDNTDSYDAYASGDVYESDTAISSVDISETNIAFPDSLLAKMRGDTVDGGVVLSGGRGTRPYFAYGCPIIKKDGTLDMRWYPKCKLTENSDKTSTSEESYKDQTDTVTIRAYGFNDNDDKAVRVLTSETDTSAITQDKFFGAVLTTSAAAKALATA